MGQLQDTDIVFIAGVEGSGTTMMSRLLEKFFGYFSLGGNHCSEGFEAETQQINDLTAQLWQLPRIEEEQRQFFLGKLNAIFLPKSVRTVVYKRSYPFLSSGYMPNLMDMPRIARSYKIILLRRHFMDNVRSIMRRGFENQESIAIQRIAQGYMHLTRQLMRIEPARLLMLDYDKLIDESTKCRELERLAQFLGLETNIVQAQASLIGKPTGG